MPTTKKTAAKKAPKKAAKKAVKKASPKKATAKKTVSKKKAVAKKTAKPMLKKASNEKSFWVTNGAVLNDLVALAHALDVMEKEVFAYHVNKSKNDFADWVEAVLDDATCASSLRKCKTPKSAKTVVVKHIKLYSV